MKILITGAGGWLGSELTKELLKNGNKVRALVITSSKKLDDLKDSYKDKLEIVIGNICNEDDIENSLKGINRVFHLAAKVHCQPKNEEDIKDFFKVNTDATKMIFDKCLKNNIEKVIFYSTVAVYGESENLITTNTVKNPVTPYGKSKLEAEEYGLKLVKEKKLPLIIIEPVTVYGGDDVGNFEKMKAFSEKGFLPKFGDGKNKKTIIYYKDLIKMTMKVADDDKFLGKRIICGTENITLNEIIETFKNNSNKKVRIIEISNTVTCIVKKVTGCKILKPLNKIGRQVHVLSSNTEFDVIKGSCLLKKKIKFEEYYGGGEIK